MQIRSISGLSDPIGLERVVDLGLFRLAAGWMGTLVEIIALWLLILLTLIAFYRVRPLASYLLLPYLVWVSFAAVLTVALRHLNSKVL
jgi:tryptophan-rich sensory protein